ncbi:MAG: hypothetical protein HXN77_08930 [Prevotella pallens]|uniref:hypothetical protein n=1 Tax=Prevotella pallens TaxID=60133 RepID=UPI001CAAF0A3|nr:hypothetical protein [Prevotella pallens]MBF1490606.1 hypothetical protein [Prevotella pallens]
MTQKTYGVYGMIEWSILLNVAGRIMNIDFEGGLASGTGIRPATFTTRNEIVQFAIENSGHFKQGRIILVSEMDIEEPKEVIAEDTEITPTDTEVAAEDNLTEVEVSSLEEAVDYLVSNFDDAKKQQLRSKVTAKAFAETKGIRFVGL